MNKIYRVMSGSKIAFYVKDVGKIGILNPVYRIWKCVNGVMVEGEDYYYLDICKKISRYKSKTLYETPINEIFVYDYKVLVRIPEHVLNMNKKDVESYILSNSCDRGLRVTRFEKISEEEMEMIRESCEYNHKDFKRINELLKGD